MSSETCKPFRRCVPKISPLALIAVLPAFLCGLEPVRAQALNGPQELRLEKDIVALWKTKGTDASTVLVNDFNPDAGSIAVRIVVS